MAYQIFAIFCQKTVHFACYQKGKSRFLPQNMVKMTKNSKILKKIKKTFKKLLTLKMPYGIFALSLDKGDANIEN